MAHYDSVFAGPGIGDDLAGVAAWLEVARALASGPALERDVILLFEDGEEQGLLGAELFAEHHPQRARGRGGQPGGRGNAGPSRMFETGRGTAGRWRASRASPALRARPRPRRGLPAHAQRHRLHGVEGARRAGPELRLHRWSDLLPPPCSIDIANLSRRSLQHHCTNGLDAVRGSQRRHSPAIRTSSPRGRALLRRGGRACRSVTVARAGSVLTLILAFAAVAALLRRPFVRPGRVLLSVPLLVLAFVPPARGSPMRLLVGALGVAVVHQAMPVL